MKRKKRISQILFERTVKRLHINKTVIQLLRPLSHHYPSLTVDEAKAILEKTSPIPKGTVLRTTQADNNEKYKYDLQIIIPAYNVEKYIVQCIKSLLIQTNEYRWQAIIIDDGSTDNTGKIIDRYKQDDRLLIIHQKNKGFSGARNTGIEYLDSRYVMFLDSDDFLERGAIKTLMKEAYFFNADIVEGNFNYYKRGKKKAGSFHLTGEIKKPVDEIRGFPWGKVIKSTFFNRYQFPEGFWFEDTIMPFLIYPQGVCVRTVERNVYNYRVNNQGITNTLYGKDKCVDTFWVLNEIVASGELLKYEKNIFQDIVINHIILSCKRCLGLEINVRESVFICLRELYLGYFRCDSILKTKESDICSAIINNDFGEYELISRFI